MKRTFSGRFGFSLIELLIVISIISVLTGMFLPGLVRAKQKARLTTCVNNLREINVGIRLYIDDHRSRFPLAKVVDKDRLEKKTTPNLGGVDPAKDRSAYWASAEVRPLYPYLGRSGSFKCPADKGLVGRTVGDEDTKPLKPSLYATIGCSYQYNGDSCLPFLAGGGYRQEPEGLLPGQLESWVQEPAMYIMMYEPPARMWCGKMTGMWTQWHYSLGANDIEDPLYARERFISPALFVDGHVSVHNFTKALTEDIYFPYERTKDWVWYQPVPPSPKLDEK